MDPIFPPWERCPSCRHHEMSHKHEMGRFICIVFECECEWTVEGDPDDE